MNRIVFLFLVMLEAAFLLEADTYDALNDLAANVQSNSPSNPNGVWSYGSEPNPGGTFTAFTDFVGNEGAYCQGAGWNPGPNGPPPYVTDCNTTIGMHPGPYLSQYSDDVVRWTAPAAGTYDVAGYFAAATPGGYPPSITTDYVLLNGTTVDTIGIDGNLGTDQSNFDMMLSVNQGDDVDFVVTLGGAPYFYNWTAFDATITSESPEPANASLVLLGIVLLAAARRFLYRHGSAQ